MRRGIADVSLAAGGAMAVVVALVMFDERVRGQLRAVFDVRHPGETLSILGQQLGDAAAIVIAAARHQSMEHAPLVIFAVAATVLVICMLRT